MSGRPPRTCLGRREFLLASARALGTASLLPPLVSVSACGPGAPVTTLDLADAGCGSGASDGGLACRVDANTLVLPLAAHPELQSTGGSLLLSDVRYRDPLCGDSQFVVAQVAEGKFAAFSAACTHACCTVQTSGGGFHCPCHGSDFTLEGQVSRGPARAALPSLPVCFDGCSVYVQLA